ncbi:hypothetical protein ES705_25550 [subsurface metagenome]
MVAESKDIRWKQRFQNFEKAFLLLKKAVSIDNPSEVERAGLIQFFEITFELSWKLMADYLEELGFVANSPRDAIKFAIQAEIIKKGHLWMDALKDRNLTVHTYEEEAALVIEKRIKEYYIHGFIELYNFIRNKMEV